MPTKRAVQKEVQSLKGINPPDTDELRRELKKGQVPPENAGLEPEIDYDEGNGAETRPPTIPEPRSEVPDPQENYYISLLKYGFKEGQARTIAEHTSQTGGADPFKNPAKMLDILNEFPYAGSPIMRKNVLDYWIQINGLTASPEYLTKAGLSKDEVKEKEEKEKEAPRVWAFDPVSGTARQATQGERGLTREELDQARAMWVQDHSKTKETDDGGVSKFTKDEPTGIWKINPNAKNVTPADIAYVES
ncbi:MAG: hypothetical protein PHN57_07840, partial [Candidatus Omnitrophica bacterium]|nr:hypothetical protein [Candidatus Omnitrophota bacterium]